MKLDRLLGFRFKETPSDCQIASHILMTRGGYIKNVGSGIFSLYPPAKRIAQKIERIMREEMDAIGGQEVMFPVAMPAALWKESGRFESVGSELLRFSDRAGADMVLGMTHEEAVVHLARGAAQSYAQYPFMVYQIQTKFRDEPRARGGLIRTREFTMKDGYSFHTSQEDLEEYYQKAYQAYVNIFRRCGIPEVVSVRSDSGMMGGKVAHEFMLVTDVGEDYLAICGECGFAANMEVAETVVENAPREDRPLEKVHTPDIKTIDGLCGFLGIAPEQTCKAVIYQKASDGALVVIFIRGDLEVNEVKLRNLLGEEAHPALNAEEVLPCGFIGPLGLPRGLTTIFDRSLRGAKNLATGACEADWHYTGFSPERDVAGIACSDVAKIQEGGVCPQCGKPAIGLKRGVEVGNIFQLGTKYTKAMNMTYLDQNGKPQYPIMGCYGIGTGRLMASVCEARHDAYGPVWPMSIAPWQVEICALRAQEPGVAAAADALYAALESAGIEVLYDDRKVSAGVMFSDADLLGVPVRAIISPKTLERGVVELKTRDKTLQKEIALEHAAQEIAALVKELMKQGGYHNA
ncbi:MAG: proline--tRNA ligase [Oscillospiraceae bacterium]|jgi:prolyl-tRNA synthetase|nr:proline--tRNA ligase [Oscillospiraceae bacterium]